LLKNGTVFITQRLLSLSLSPMLMDTGTEKKVNILSLETKIKSIKKLINYKLKRKRKTLSSCKSTQLSFPFLTHLPKRFSFMLIWMKKKSSQKKMYFLHLNHRQLKLQSPFLIKKMENKTIKSKVIHILF